MAEVGPDGRVVVAAAVLAVITAGLVGLAPLWASARPTSGRSWTRRHGRDRPLDGRPTPAPGLVMAQVALRLGARGPGRAVHSQLLAAVLDLDPGSVPIMCSRCRSACPIGWPVRRAAGLLSRVLHALRDCRAWSRSGGTTRMPLASATTRPRCASRAQLRRYRRPCTIVGFRRTLHDYFALMRIPVRHGRAIHRRDGRRRPRPPSSTKRRRASFSAGATRRTAAGARRRPGRSMAHRRRRRRRCPPRQSRGGGAAELYTNYSAGPPFAPFVACAPAAIRRRWPSRSASRTRRSIPASRSPDVRTMDGVRLASIAERRFTLVLVRVRRPGAGPGGDGRLRRHHTGGGRTHGRSSGCGWPWGAVPASLPAWWSATPFAVTASAARLGWHSRPAWSP